MGSWNGYTRTKVSLQNTALARFNNVLQIKTTTPYLTGNIMPNFIHTRKDLFISAITSNFGHLSMSLTLHALSPLVITKPTLVFH